MRHRDHFIGKLDQAGHVPSDDLIAFRRNTHWSPDQGISNDELGKPGKIAVSRPEFSHAV
jgi:hypothetical protein